MEKENYNKHDIVMKRPSSACRNRWLDGTPIGNGYTGAILYGGTAGERLIINRSDLWFIGEDGPVPDVSYCLPKMRELQKQGKYREANDYMYNALKEAGYKTTLADMRTLGEVRLGFDCEGIYNHYRRVLHLDKAEAEISYNLDKTPYKRKYFASRKRDIIVVEVSSNKKMNFSLQSGFMESYGGNRETRVRAWDAEFAKYRAKGECYFYSSKNGEKYFGIASRVVSDGDVTVLDDGIFVKGACKSLVLIKVFSEEKDRMEAEEFVFSELNACPRSYKELFEENLSLYTRLYQTADITLYDEEYHSNEELLAEARENEMPIELAEKLWRFGRYMFISGTSATGLPFPLYGLWPYGYICEFTHHVANENVQSIYWHTDVGGLSELVPALIDYYYKRMDGFRENARQLYGCRGIFVGTYTTPRNAVIAWWVPVILHFCGAAGWLASHFYRYYTFTGDERLFEEKILPFMLEAAAFYEDYHYYDENGKLVLYPAVSPENSPIEYHDRKLPHSMPVTKNPTVEIAILKELLQNLISVCKVRPKFTERVRVWEEMLSKLPEYLINKDGAIAEWIVDDLHDAYDHRHVSHLYPVFPGTELEDSQNKQLIDACKRAVDLRYGSFGGWSLPHMSAIYSRLRDPEKAFDSINALSKVCLLENLMTMNYDYREMGITGFECGDEYHTMVQFDALMGTVNALQEMLLFTSPKILRLLPACPKQFSKGNATLHFSTGLVEMCWDLEKETCSGKITALRDTDIQLELPFGKGKRALKMKQGETIDFC